ncbi:MAG: hypothetical protein WAW06_02625, partial [bacterium]
GLDHALPDIGEIGAQHDDLIGSLKHAQPGLHGIDGKAEVAGQVGYIEELCTARGQQAEETLKLM